MHRTILYALSSFWAGFALMTLELVAARIVAPLVGSSVYSWTAVIGIVLFGLSIGAYVGGAIIDRRAHDGILSWTFLISALLVLLILPVSHIAQTIVTHEWHLFVIILTLASALFLPASFVIGMLQPMILKRYADTFADIGKEYGLLSAMWSLGSIIGVFGTGFYFVSVWGSRFTLDVVAGVLIIFGIMFAVRDIKHRRTQRSIAIPLLLILAIMVIFSARMLPQANTARANVVHRAETPYYLAQVADTSQGRYLFLDIDSHSVANTDTPPAYIQTHEIFDVFTEVKNVHVIGGGGFTMSRALADTYPDADISVSELDPEVVSVAKEYFPYPEDRIDVRIGDARRHFTHGLDTKYDVVFNDAYNSFISVPWHLTTKEFLRDVRKRIHDGGIYAVNFVSATSGEKSRFLNAMVKTAEQVFDRVHVFQTKPDGETRAQNIVLIAERTKDSKGYTDEKLKDVLMRSRSHADFAQKLMPRSAIDTTDTETLTDDHAPVASLMQPVMTDYFPQYTPFYYNAIGGHPFN